MMVSHKIQFFCKKTNRNEAVGKDIFCSIDLKTPGFIMADA